MEKEVNSKLDRVVRDINKNGILAKRADKKANQGKLKIDTHSDDSDSYFENKNKGHYTIDHTFNADSGDEDDNYPTPSKSRNTGIGKLRTI